MVISQPACKVPKNSAIGSCELTWAASSLLVPCSHSVTHSSPCRCHFQLRISVSRPHNNLSEVGVLSLF